MVMGVKSGPHSRFSQLEASELHGWRGMAVGYLLLMHDVTEQKHSQAQFAQQQRALATEQSSLKLTVEDDGFGFNPGEIAEGDEAFGLKTIAERALSMSGKIQVTSQTGSSPRLPVQVPMNPEFKPIISLARSCRYIDREVHVENIAS